MRKQKNNKPLCKKNDRGKVKSSGFPKCETKYITGQSSKRRLDAYDSGNEAEMFEMSSAISKFKYSTSTVVQKKFHPSPSPEQCKLDFSKALHTTPIDNNNFSYGINSNDFSFLFNVIFSRVILCEWFSLLILDKRN